MQVTAIGGTLLRTMPHIEAAHYLVPNPALTALSNLPGVKHISLNRKLKASFDQITDGTVHSDYATFKSGRQSPRGHRVAENHRVPGDSDCYPGLAGRATHLKTNRHHAALDTGSFRV
jgi:hypothetical protein